MPLRKRGEGENKPKERGKEGERMNCCSSSSSSSFSPWLSWHFLRRIFFSLSLPLFPFPPPLYSSTALVYSRRVFNPFFAFLPRMCKSQAREGRKMGVGVAQKMGARYEMGKMLCQHVLSFNFSIYHQLCFCIFACNDISSPDQIEITLFLLLWQFQFSFTISICLPSMLYGERKGGKKHNSAHSIAKRCNLLTPFLSHDANCTDSDTCTFFAVC